MKGSFFLFVFLLMSAFGISFMSCDQDKDDGIYVWRNSTPPTFPIGSDADIKALLDFCRNQGIQRILYDNWGNGEMGGGSGRQDDAFLNKLIYSAHMAGAKIEALYTDKDHISDVLDYHSRNYSLLSLRRFGRISLRFDGIRMNFEGPWPSGRGIHEPTSSADIQYYADAKVAAGTVPLYASIGWHWDNNITYNGNAKPAYKHILYLLDGVDIQPGRGVAGDAHVIARRAQPIVAYADSLGKLAWITIETSPSPPRDETFADEGEEVMKAETRGINQFFLDLLVTGSPVVVILEGFIYHYYLRSYGSGSGGWPTHP